MQYLLAESSRRMRDVHDRDVERKDVSAEREVLVPWVRVLSGRVRRGRVRSRHAAGPDKAFQTQPVQAQAGTGARLKERPEQQLQRQRRDDSATWSRGDPNLHSNDGRRSLVLPDADETSDS